MRRPTKTWKNPLDQLGNVLKKFVRTKPSPKRPPTCRLAAEQLERRDMFTVTISNFHLLNDTGASATDLVTSDPRVTATAGGSFTSAQIQFDHNNDGISDGQTEVLRRDLPQVPARTGERLLRGGGETVSLPGCAFLVSDFGPSRRAARPRSSLFRVPGS